MSGYFGAAFAQSYLVSQLIDLPFLPDPLPRGFAVWDGAVHAIADYPRLFAKIGQRWRRDDDTYDTDTHFRFGGGAVFRKGATFTPSSAGFVYPLDASEEEITSPLFGANGKMTMSGGDQIATYTAQGEQAFSLVYGAAPTGFATMTSATMDLARGAPEDMELVFNLPDLSAVPGSGTVLSGGVQLVNAATFAAILRVQVDVWADTNLVRFTYYGHGGAIASEVDVPTGEHRLTVEFNSDSGTLAIRRNNGEVLELSDNTYTPAEALIVLQAQEVAGTDASIAGKQLSIQLVTRADSILYPITAEATDLGGNAVGGGGGGGSYTFGRLGSDTTEGHVLTLAELPSDGGVTLPVGARNASSSGGDPSWPVQVGNGDNIGDQSLSLNGGDQAHSHGGVNPVHDAVVTLVRI